MLFTKLLVDVSKLLGREPHHPPRRLGWPSFIASGAPGLVVPTGVAESPLKVRLFARNDALADRDCKRQHEDQHRWETTAIVRQLSDESKSAGGLSSCGAMGGVNGALVDARNCAVHCQANAPFIHRNACRLEAHIGASSLFGGQRLTAN